MTEAQVKLIIAILASGLSDETVNAINEQIKIIKSK